MISTPFGSPRCGSLRAGFFGSRAAHALSVVGLLVSLVLSGTPAAAENAPAVVLFRIFLADGTSLVSFGEFARVADRVVFSVPLGEGAEPRLHVVSIPETRVDWQRTEEYAAAVRAQRYAATRGESDFKALAAQVTAVLGEIALTSDASKRVALAQEARRTLAAWPAQNYGYRSADVAQLVGMLDDVVAEMRIAAGHNAFDLSLVATAAPPPAPPLLNPPDVRTSLESGYRAALLAADPDEKIALLRTITEQLDFAPSSATWAPVLKVRGAAALAAELRVEKTYQDLVARSLKSAAERAGRADVRGLQQIIADVLSADDRLGRKRSGQVTSLLAMLDSRLDEARRLRLARDSWASRVELLRDYRTSIKVARERIQGLRKWLGHISDLSGPDPAVLPRLDAHAAEAQRRLSAVTPPPELQDTHGVFVAAIHMIRQAAALRRQAIATNNLKLAWDASSAAAGALLLWQRATDDLTRIVSGPPALVEGGAPSPAPGR